MPAFDHKLITNADVTTDLVVRIFGILHSASMPQEEYIFRALRQQMLWPSIHAAIDVYQRRRSSSADHYELIWRLIHICECTALTLAAAAITRIRGIEVARSDYLKLRERCYGVNWNSTEGEIEKSLGALDGSIDKWIEMLQHIASFSIEGSRFLTGLQTFLVGPEQTHFVDMSLFVRAWSRACDVPQSVTAGKASVKETIQAINSFRNRFAHVPFPYDQVQDIYHELEVCVFKIFEIPPSAANDESPLSGCFALKASVLRGAGHHKAPEKWTSPDYETFVWGKLADVEVWDARPFIFLDKMMRPYLLSRLKNDAGSWEYIRFLAEANAVYSVSDPELLKLLPRPTEGDYHKHVDDDEHPDATLQLAQTEQRLIPAIAKPGVFNRDDALTAVKERNFEPAIDFFKKETVRRPYYHSAWQRLGFAQREYGVDLIESDRQKSEALLQESILSFTHATGHVDPQYAAEAYYNRSKSHWRLGRLTKDQNQMQAALLDAKEAAKLYYDHRFVSWTEFLNENIQDQSSSVVAGH